MKKYILIGLLSAFAAQAAPVLNKNVASAGKNITFWPDHRDPDQFYFAPTIMKLARNEKGEVLFSAFDYTYGRCGLRRCDKLILTSYFEAGYREKEFEEARQKLLAQRPNARFSPVPFMSSQVEFGKTMLPFIDDHNCAPIGGQSTDLVPCSITLNQKGVSKLVPRLQEGSLLAFNFKYKIYGVHEGVSPQYTEHEGEYAIAVNLGGEELRNHPDLDI